MCRSDFRSELINAALACLDFLSRDGVEVLRRHHSFRAMEWYEIAFQMRYAYAPNMRAVQVMRSSLFLSGFWEASDRVRTTPWAIKIRRGCVGYKCLNLNLFWSG